MCLQERVSLIDAVSTMRASRTGTPRTTTQHVADPEPELEDEGPEPARDDEMFAQLADMVDGEGARARPREMAQLEGLHSEGMLTDEEFAAAEEILAAKLLAAKKLRNTPAQHGRPAPAAEPEPDPEPEPEPKPEPEPQPERKPAFVPELETPELVPPSPEPMPEDSAEEAAARARLERLTRLATDSEMEEWSEAQVSEVGIFG